jgi:hypothetical protein
MDGSTLEGVSAQKTTGLDEFCNVTNVSAGKEAAIFLLRAKKNFVIPTRGFGARNLLCRCRQKADSSLRSE